MLVEYSMLWASFLFKGRVFSSSLPPFDVASACRRHLRLFGSSKGQYARYLGPCEQVVAKRGFFVRRPRTLKLFDSMVWPQDMASDAQCLCGSLTHAT